MTAPDPSLSPAALDVIEAAPDRPVRLTRHADHDPSLTCRPALGYGLCEVLEVKSDSNEGDSMSDQAVIRVNERTAEIIRGQYDGELPALFAIDGEVPDGWVLDTRLLYSRPALTSSWSGWPAPRRSRGHSAKVTCPTRFRGPLRTCGRWTTTRAWRLAMAEPLSEAIRMQAGQCLNTAGQTAASACWLLEHDDAYSASSLLTDIAAIEAALKRARQAIPAPEGSGHA